MRNKHNRPWRSRSYPRSETFGDFGDQPHSHLRWEAVLIADAPIAELVKFELFECLVFPSQTADLISRLIG